MSYRFLNVTCLYNDFLRRYYNNFPEIKLESYTQQYDHLMAQGCGWAVHIEKNLQQLGIESSQIVVNAQPLQAAWCRENLTREATGLDLLLEQIAHIKPTVLFFEDPLGFEPAWLRAVKEKVSSIRLVIGYHCAPYRNQRMGIMGDLDFLLTCTPGFVQDFQSMGINAHLVLHAFEGSLLPELRGQGAPVDAKVAFTGSFFAGQNFHDGRGLLIADLLKNNVPMDIYGQIVEPPYYRAMVKSAALSVAKWLTRSRYGESIEKWRIIRRISEWDISARDGGGFPPEIRNCIKPPLYGLEMLKVLSGHSVALNIHGGVAGDYAGNVRLFEATGAGTCLLTDWKKNLGNLFELDKEVVAFSSTEECIEKARWLLDHPSECAQIARAGQMRTLRDHSFSNRAKEIDSLVRASL